MTEEEQTHELGQMVFERRSLSAKRICMRNRLKRYRAAFWEAYHLTESPKSERKKVGDLPDREEFLSLIGDYIETDERINEIDAALTGRAE